MVGSPPNTTYGENIGVMAITGVYSVWVIRGAHFWQSLFRLSGKSLPYLTFNSVMGGITMLLYGVVRYKVSECLWNKK
jgi:uracil permease